MISGVSHRDLPPDMQNAIYQENDNGDDIIRFADGKTVVMGSNASNECFMNMTGTNKAEFFEGCDTAKNTILANGGNDIMKGNAGNDNLRGGNDNDMIFGGNDNDTLVGENGADQIWGGGGSDLLNGGAALDKPHSFERVAHTGQLAAITKPRGPFVRSDTCARIVVS